MAAGKNPSIPPLFVNGVTILLGWEGVTPTNLFPICIVKRIIWVIILSAEQKVLNLASVIKIIVDVSMA